MNKNKTKCECCSKLSNELQELIKFSFSLSNPELKMFLELCKCKSEQCARDISKRFKRDRSTVQKILIKLYEKKIVEKKKLILQGGGYKFYYVPINKEELKKKCSQVIKNWSKNSIKILSNM